MDVSKHQGEDGDSRIGESKKVFLYLTRRRAETGQLRKS